MINGFLNKTKEWTDYSRRSMMKQDSSPRHPARVWRHELAQFTRLWSVNHLWFILQIVTRFTWGRLYIEAAKSYAVFDEPLLSSLGNVRNNLLVLCCRISSVDLGLAKGWYLWGGGRWATLHSTQPTTYPEVGGWDVVTADYCCRYPLGVLSTSEHRRRVY